MNKIVIGIISFFLIICLDVQAGSLDGEKIADNVFMQVDDLVITDVEFIEIFDSAVRYKYYHGRIPDEEINAFREKVIEDLVTQILIHNEALKIGIQADKEKIDQGIEVYNLKYADRPEWLAQREQVIPLLSSRLERQDIIEKMQVKIKDLPPPSEDQVVEYYRQYPEKFTEPKRLWVSVILLSVPPSANEMAWDEALDAGQQLKQRIQQGEDFATLAKQYSGHASATIGGDLGYLHQGMLQTEVKDEVEGLSINQVSDPLLVLEGVGLFRVNGIQKAEIKPLGEVKQRARDLLHQALQDQVWENYVTALEEAAEIYINKNLYVLNNNE